MHYAEIVVLFYSKRETARDSFTNSNFKEINVETIKHLKHFARKQ